MLRLVKKDYIIVLEWGFKIAYLLLGLASFNAFLYSSPIQPMVVKICLLLGILTLAGRIIFFKDYIRTPYWIVLALYCVSFFITIFVNRSYGKSTADIKWLIWTGMLFFLLYICDTTRDINSYKKEFTVLAHIMMIYGMITALIGIAMMAGAYHSSWFTGDGEKMLAGFHWERLWGVYTDPNYGAVFSVIIILLCMYFCRKARTWRKGLYIAAIVLNYLYLVFSDSRTGEVCMVVTAAFWLIYSSVFKWKVKSGIVIGILASVLFAAVFMGGTTYIKEQISPKVQQQIIKKDAVKNNKSKLQGGRKADIQKDVSNGRFSLWKSGVEIWKTKPVLGTGYNSFLPYVKGKLPETYVVKNPQGEYVSLHNTYLNVLVYQGVVGAAIFVFFALLTLKYWIQSIYMVKKEDLDYIAVLTACVIAISISMIFILEGIYTNSPGSFILWTFLGYLMHALTSIRKNGVSEVQMK